LQPPPSIDAIPQAEPLRRQLDELWTAANCLRIALDTWRQWFVDLGRNGDAHPGIALNCGDMARRAIKVLVTHRPNVELFGHADEGALMNMLPPIPEWWIPESGAKSSDATREMLTGQRIRWQEDRMFLDRY